MSEHIDPFARLDAALAEVRELSAAIRRTLEDDLPYKADRIKLLQGERKRASYSVALWLRAADAALNAGMLYANDGDDH